MTFEVNLSFLGFLSKSTCQAGAINAMASLGKHVLQPSKKGNLCKSWTFLREKFGYFFIFRWSPSYLWRSLLASRCGLCWCKFFLGPSWSKWKHDPAYKHAILTLNIATKWTYSWKINQAKLIQQLWQQWCYSETPPGLKKRTQSLRLGNSGLEWTAPGSISAARMHGQSSSSICSSGLPFDPCSSSH